MHTSKLFVFSLLTGLHTLVFCGEITSPAEKLSLEANMEARVNNLLTKVKASLRPLKGGTFEMGDWGNEKGTPYDFDAHSRPVHEVTLDDFSMMAYKVTYEDFDVFTDATRNERINMDPEDMEDRAPKRPAGVSWHGAKAYCRWLANITKLPFDLPTEAQWEYAARSGGKKVLFATDNGKIERGRNFPEKWKHGERKPRIPEVGSYPPNPAGLYGMSEDTGEWINDWFSADYYKISLKNNPTGPSDGTKKLMRGSVGGTSEISAMVFMRTGRLPQPMQTTYPNGIRGGEVTVPFPGYSGYQSSNFRCINSGIIRKF
ncbi:MULTISPECIES: SUMF1/EgtB/PvdO family nonheme iron enzyme [unclassified Massilia]|uniref:formylglycine-generating enzyme family protein n=1 Tax=unclassified Massilia TaxID=2609279 RepID=UPI00177BC8CE|nr:MULTISPECIES: SUMF1/EgtB/PvdO family nonheme iron enzyme [unclassified Massilia]MBD8531776.1 SUMF1/EgtB/PvdO family nonheme iron enzyme [Massilia sp. CFBP 13647]MBD8675221.1 SUMF1/EgtB/PvdO family nonheme iron enzyme [Massilia sp. CFBP 13721]